MHDNVPMATLERAGDGTTSEVRRLSTLLDVSRALSSTLDLKAALHNVLEILGKHHGAVRGMIALLNEDTRDLHVEATDGLIRAGTRARYAVGEGITGRVVETGKPIVVPRVSREPLFLNRASDRPELARQELSYICVPITLNRKAIGALGVDLRFKGDRDYDR